MRVSKVRFTHRVLVTVDRGGFRGLNKNEETFDLTFSSLLDNYFIAFPPLTIFTSSWLQMGWERVRLSLA